MQERFENAEIGVAQFCPLDALFRMRHERLKGFHENEPNMNATGVLHWIGFFPSHWKLFVDKKYIDVNILDIKPQH